MVGLLYLVQRGEDWAGRSPLRYILAVPNVTAQCPPINGQCTNHRLDNGALLSSFNVVIKMG